MILVSETVSYHFTLFNWQVYIISFTEDWLHFADSDLTINEFVE